MPEQDTNSENRIDISDSGAELEDNFEFDSKESPLPPPIAGSIPAPEGDVQEIELEMSQEAADYVQQLQAQLDEAIAARQRAQADFSNYQRRAMENEQRALTTGSIRVIHALLPVLDHFDLSLNQELDSLTVEKLMNGVKIVRDEVTNALQMLGVESIDPQIGDEFNPNCHEAMMRQEAEGIPPNHIVMVMQSGYMMGDMVLRPAKVAVAPGGDD